ncbi:MAG: hypothetical protein J7J70_02270 [Deltaproteobacteria bacterium]|nr:hypothetical protein [Candidatus Tharpellaceae bacterium]
MSKEILQNIVDDFSPEKFIRFFRQKNHSFTPFQESIDYYNDEDFSDGKKLGEIAFTPGEKLIVYSFKVNKNLTERSGKKAQYVKSKKILKEIQADAGIFVFHDSESNFRFSLIYIDYFGTKRKFSYYKRFTFYVSPKLTNKTFLQQVGECSFLSLEEIKSAFSVEPVTKQFYEELQTWYFWAMDKIKFPVDYKYNEEPEKDKEIRNAINLIRLITRIIFIWFLKQKGLVDRTLFDRGKLKNIVKGFMEDQNASNYYNAILQNLFFATLNQKMDKRKFAKDGDFFTNREQYDVKTLYRYADKFLINKDKVLEFFKDIPFLNGGLFDCLDKEKIYIDGFSRNAKKQAIIPDYLFFQKNEIKVGLSKYGLGMGKPVRGLTEILKSYNFTIDENTPIDQEVALDPELLGRVFENLLASYNPETATTARKATGSYYTPREIVNYMVDESIFYYLKDKFPDISEEDFRLLISYSDEIPESCKARKQDLISAIDNIKILDPACGSGAFPMGILHKLVYILQKLDPKNEYWYELQYQKALKASEEVFKKGSKAEREEILKEINEAFDESTNYPGYARKLYLIENCIYGVDIQPIAIQISKLRFFISLILDQKVDKGKENFGIRALPNLETKFVTANTLMGIEIPDYSLVYDNSKTKQIQDKLAETRHKYFKAKTRREKLKYQKQDLELRKKLAEIIKSLLLNRKQGEIAQVQEEIKNNEKKLQQAIQEIKKIKKYIKDYEKQLRTLQKQAEGDFTVQIAKKIANFDLFDQNASASWFDPEWMFGVKDGFDIVIANPPYGFRNVLSAEEKRFFRKIMRIEFPTGDIAELFILITLGKCVRNNGVLTYIIPKKSLYGESWKNVRKVWLKNDLDFLMDASQAFENVLLEQVAFSIQKRNPALQSIAVGALDSNSNTVRVFGRFPRRDIFTSDLSNAQIYRGLYAKSLLKKIFKQASPDTATLIKAVIGISNITSHLTFESQNNYPCVKGIDIIRYGLKQDIRYVKGEIAKQYIGDYQDEKIVAQKIIAHIQNPMPHILITMFLDNEKRLINDTCVEIKVLNGKLTKKFMLAYFQSSFCNWYAYNFVYNRAIRTMDFINYYVTQIPIPHCVTENPKQQQPFIDIVDNILSITKNDDYLQNPQKQAKVKELEKQIDQMVYKLYGLTPEEIKIVESSQK